MEIIHNSDDFIPSQEKKIHISKISKISLTKDKEKKAKQLILNYLMDINELNI